MGSEYMRRCSRCEEGRNMSRRFKHGHPSFLAGGHIMRPTPCSICEHVVDSDPLRNVMKEPPSLL